MNFSLKFLLLTVSCLMVGCSALKENSAESIIKPKKADAINNDLKTPQARSKRSITGNPVSYELKGKTYYVLPTSKGYVSEGIASWYGPGFHGHETANGEIFDMNELSAAHKTLPIPCKVRVTNLLNGKRIDLRINDRGPYYHDREIDLSLAAAKALDIDKTGTSQVKIEAIDNDDEPNEYFLQVSAYRKTERAKAIAESFKKRLEKDSIPALLVEGHEYYTLKAGPLLSMQDISIIKQKLNYLGIKELFYAHIN